MVLRRGLTKETSHDPNPPHRNWPHPSLTGTLRTCLHPGRLRGLPWTPGRCPRVGLSGRLLAAPALGGLAAQELYFNPNAEWSRYDSIQLDSVTLWANEDTGKLGDEDQQMLTDTLFKALHEELSKYFEMSDQPGPNTIRMRAALTQAKGAKTALRAISSLHPGTLLLGAAVGLSLDTANSVGTATLEVELLDAITNQRLAAAVDQRAGTKAFALIAPKRTFSKWGDVEAIANYWAERAAIVLLKQGVRPKEGAPEPPKG